MSHPTVLLNNNIEIPQLGLGVYRSAPGTETRQAVSWALELGYRHIDTAAAYGNEDSVGEALRSSTIPRSQIFVTTKLRNEDHGYTEALRALDVSLRRLNLDYLDLWLIHWPVERLRLETWRAFERVLEDGRARAVGVSNYMVRHLEELFAHSTVKPAVNQIELHPFIYRTRAEVLALCHDTGIVIEAYSPLTKARRLKHPLIQRIARAHGKTSAQILIRYALDKKTIVLAKSVHRQRISENAAVFDFTLTPADHNMLDALDERLATGWDPTDAP
jgi:diketogulonate reductase-like aldo/keto reductase